MKRLHFVLVVNHNYGTGKVNCYEKVNGFVKEKLENVNFSKFVNRIYKILGELEIGRRTSSFCDFSTIVQYIFLLLPMFNRNRLHHFLVAKGHNQEYTNDHYK